MKPVYFKLANGLPIVILPERRGSDHNTACIFQVCYGTPEQQVRSLDDLNNYFGLVSFDPANQQFYYSSGNRMIMSDEILQVIDCIKNKILNL